MRLLTIALLILLLLLQYRLWFGQHSVSDYLQLNQQLEQQALANEELAKRNRLLLADVDDLRLGLEAIEERARNELGMIREDEIFFRIVTDSPSLHDQRQGITLPLRPERR